MTDFFTDYGVLLVAVYAAALSTCLAVKGWLNNRVKIEINVIDISGFPALEIINRGQKEVHITYAGILSPQGKLYVKLNNYRYMDLNGAIKEFPYILKSLDKIYCDEKIDFCNLLRKNQNYEVGDQVALWGYIVNHENRTIKGKKSKIFTIEH